eukprot:gnl/Hemi2/6540_TR2233_c0_g1_i1.p1 gnl/Hemi2/6540_TR2233_c0_g1~~gnl/Hemi2/6540_TR2233_c0_g1_i1.p1  ORF type:complete len:210 (-),score=18.34 gnl/Hemi2/6540_TR2233_c0_g1_i1:396-1025(-)
MGTYLEDFLEAVSSLPSELNRNFTLMGELDSKTQVLLEKVDENTNQLVSRIHARPSKKGPRAVLQDEDNMVQGIKTDYCTCLELADEKVALAIQTYDMIDSYIRRLDNDLGQFESELRQDRKFDQFFENRDKDRRAGTVAAPPPSNSKGRGKKTQKHHTTTPSRIPPLCHCQLQRRPRPERRPRPPHRSQRAALLCLSTGFVWRYDCLR